jgi:hypothetical protein
MESWLIETESPGGTPAKASMANRSLREAKMTYTPAEPLSAARHAG